MTPTRRLPFEGAVNFRDLGGYPAGSGRMTRWNRIYRSDSLAELTDADLDRLSSMGLYGLVDFRLPAEAAKKPNRLPPDHSIRMSNPGFLPQDGEIMLDRVRAGTITYDELMAEMTLHYKLYAQRHLPNYAPLFRLILEADGKPVLIHCTSGKDRTGWGSALVLLAAGCDDETIITDFLLTNDYRRDLAFMLSNKVTPEINALLTSVHRVFMITALEELRRLHGNGEGWMEQMGLDAAERSRLRALITMPEH